MDRLEGVFLDMDGTAYQFNPDQDAAYQQATTSFLAEKLSLSLGAAELEKVKLIEVHGSLNGFMKKKGWHNECAARVYNDAVSPEKFHSRNDGLMSVLRFIRERGIKIGVLTTSPNSVEVQFARKTLDVLGVLELVDAVQGSEAPYVKPDVEAFKYMAQALGLKDFSKIASIGDDPPKDLEPAKLLGATTILVTENGKPRDVKSLIALPYVDHSIKTVWSGELVDLIRRGL